MSTPQTWSTVVDQSTDAAFRTWVAEFITKMLATGTLTQTADAGQINTATVVRAAINTEAGFVTFSLSDSLSATAPVIFRVGFGSGSAITIPRIQITVGTGTNGSGAVTGTALTVARNCNAQNTAISSTVTAYNSYMCATTGFWGFTWKGGVANTQNGNRGSFYFSRSFDTAGIASAQGGYCFWGSGSATQFTAYQNLRFASTALAYTAVVNVGGTIPCVIPGSVVSSLVGSNFQAYLQFGAYPDVQALPPLGTVILSEVPVANTFTLAPVAGVSHTYLSLGNINPSETTSSTTYAQYMLWE